MMMKVDWDIKKIWLLKSRLRARYKRLRHILPLDLNFELTPKCNLNCRYCGREYIMLNKLRDSNDMSLDLVKRVVEEFAIIAKKTHSSILVGPVGLGEPLLDSRFFEIVSLIRQYIPKAYIHANTNGLLLNERNIKKVVNSELDSLILSINTWSRDDYLSLHKLDYFNNVRSNIINLLKTPRGHKPKIIVQLLDISLNAQKMDAFKNYWKQFIKPTDSIYIRPFSPLKKHIRKMMPNEELNTYLKYLGAEDYKLTKKRYPCYALFGTCMIDKDGYIFPCCMGLWFSHESDLCLGNIKETSIRDVYRKGSKLYTLRKLHLQGKWDSIDACKECNSWVVMPNIFFKLRNRWI